MKKLKISLLAAVLAVSVVAFSQARINHNVDEETWFLIPGGNPNNPLHYSLESQGFDCQEEATIICSIRAEEEDDAPVLDKGLVTANPVAYDASFRD